MIARPHLIKFMTMPDLNNRRPNEEESDELWDDEMPVATDPEREADSFPEDDKDSFEDAGRRPTEDNDDDFYDDAADAGDAGMDYPKRESKTIRKRLFELDEEDDDDNDYFNNDVEPAPGPKPKPKPVKLDPEDPDYWMGEEPEFPSIISRHKKMWKWILAAVVALVVALTGLWFWFFHPYVDGAVRYGYIKSMERRGTFMKTFEGVLIPYRELGDETPMYFEEIPFSVDGDSLAARMKAMMLDCIPVRLEYEEYHSPLFWKGAEKMIVVGADTADVDKILPPDYRFK